MIDIHSFIKAIFWWVLAKLEWKTKESNRPVADKYLLSELALLSISKKVDKRKEKNETW